MNIHIHTFALLFIFKLQDFSFASEDKHYLHQSQQIETKCKSYMKATGIIKMYLKPCWKNKRKQVRLILIMCSIQPNISRTLSCQYVINMKLLRHLILFLFALSLLNLWMLCFQHISICTSQISIARLSELASSCCIDPYAEHRSIYRDILAFWSQFWWWFWICQYELDYNFQKL